MSIIVMHEKYFPSHLTIYGVTNCYFGSFVSFMSTQSATMCRITCMNVFSVCVELDAIANRRHNYWNDIYLIHELNRFLLFVWFFKPVSYVVKWLTRDFNGRWDIWFWFTWIQIWIFGIIWHDSNGDFSPLSKMGVTYRCISIAYAYTYGTKPIWG